MINEVIVDKFFELMYVLGRIDKIYCWKLGRL